MAGKLNEYIKHSYKKYLLTIPVAVQMRLGVRLSSSVVVSNIIVLKTAVNLQCKSKQRSPLQTFYGIFSPDEPV